MPGLNLLHTQHWGQLPYEWLPDGDAGGSRTKLGKPHKRSELLLWCPARLLCHSGVCQMKPVMNEAPQVLTRQQASTK